MRTATHLYIRNFTPERWPAGAPRKYESARYDALAALIEGKLGPEHGGYHDIDDGPTLQWMIAHRDQAEVGKLLAAAVDLRPREELYDIQSDPSCLTNLAEHPDSQDVKNQLSKRLTDYLARTGDLRQSDPQAAHVWESYPRHSSLRWFPDPAWLTEGGTTVPEQNWLEKRRPR